MKKTLGVVELVAALVALGASAVLAEPAVVISNFDCTILDGNGSLVFVSDKTHSVATDSTTQTATLTCKNTDPVTPPPGGKAVHWNYENTGLPCNVPNVGTTTVWKETVSASGQAILVCHFKIGP